MLAATIEETPGPFLVGPLGGKRRRSASFNGLDHDPSDLLLAGKDAEVGHQIPRNLWALEEVGPRYTNRLAAFLKRYPDARPLMIGGGAMDLE